MNKIIIIAICVIAFIVIFAYVIALCFASESDDEEQAEWIRQYMKDKEEGEE